MILGRFILNGLVRLLNTYHHCTKRSRIKSRSYFPFWSSDGPSAKVDHNLETNTTISSSSIAFYIKVDRKENKSIVVCSICSCPLCLPKDQEIRIAKEKFILDKTAKNNEDSVNPDKFVEIFIPLHLPHERRLPFPAPENPEHKNELDRY